MKQKFFYFNRLKSFDIYAICIYIILSLWMYLYVTSEAKLGRISEGSLPLFALIIQTVGYVYLYKPMRNLSVYLIWFFFGLIHLAVYFIIDNDLSLQGIYSGYSILRNTVILLLLYQVLRFISVTIQHREFVIPSKYRNMHLAYEPNATYIDKLLFVSYFLSAAGLMFWH